MKRFFNLRLFTILALALFATTASAQTHTQTRQATPAPVHKVRPYAATPTYSYNNGSWYSTHSPWDFTGQLGLYNPGFGFQGLAAYRVVDRLLNTVDDSISIETGLGYVAVNDTVASASISYSLIEIPIMARWDFHLLDQKLIVGPRAGFDVLLGGGTTTVNNVSYSIRGNSLYFQIGGFGTYKFTENWGARVGIMFINYTAFTFGVAYFL